MPKEYRTIQEVAGPLMLVRGVEHVSYDELGEIELASGEVRRCKVLEVNGSDADDDYYVNNHADDDEYDDFYWEHGGYLGEEDSETFEYSEDEEY